MGWRTYGGNAYSENGWRICDRAQCDLIYVPDTDGAYFILQRGPQASLLIAWANWYHNNVAPIDEYKPTDDWGWSAENAVNNSNHLSGTGIDINATQWPWGLRRMPAKMKAKIEEGLKLFGGLIYWGAWWDRADEMHFQTWGNAKQVEEFVAKNIRDNRLVGSAAVEDPNSDDWQFISGQMMGSAN